MDNNYDFNEVLAKLKFFSTNNLFFTLFYSGCGIPYFFSEKEIDHLNSICKDDNKEFLENLMPLRCLYKRARAVFSEAPHEIINPGKYVWDFDSFEKEINIPTQTFSVLSMLYLLNSKKYDSKLFKYVAQRQSKNFLDFITGFLRNKDGLFVDAEDKTRYLNEELRIKQEKDIDVLNQFYVFEMLLGYSHYLKENNMQNEFYKNEANVLFKFIFENFNSVLELTTRDISLIASSLYRCSSFSLDESMLTSINELIALSCAEVESRIKINGEVEKSSNNYVPASIITHFRAASCLYEGYILTKIDKFKNAANRIIGFLFELFDENIGLFRTMQSEIKYSIRDIAEILKCLLLYYEVKQDKSVLEKLFKFFKSAIEESGIVQSVTAYEATVDGIEIVLDKNIPIYSETSSAPVFLRSFNYSDTRLEKYSTSKFTNLYYSIYATYIMLNALERYLDKNIRQDLHISNLEESKNDEINETDTKDTEIILESKIESNEETGEDN